MIQANFTPINFQRFFEASEKRKNMYERVIGMWSYCFTIVIWVVAINTCLPICFQQGSPSASATCTPWKYKSKTSYERLKKNELKDHTRAWTTIRCHTTVLTETSILVHNHSYIPSFLGIILRRFRQLYEKTLIYSLTICRRWYQS